MEGRERLPIFALLLANAVSVVGNAMTAVAVPWFVLQTTGSAAKTGLTGAVMALGAVLAAFFGGSIVDRLGFKQTSITADLMSGATVALIPLLYAAGYLPFWQLLVLVFLGAVLDAPGMSARDAMIPDLARSARMRLERANSLDASVPRLAQFLGPPLAGVLIVFLGATGVLWLDAATFAVSAAIVTVAVPAVRFTAEKDDVESRSGYLSELLAGLRFVRTNLLIFSMILVATAANFLDAPLQAVILPVYANEVFGSAPSLGAMLGSFGGGALAGTLLFGLVGHRLPRRLTFVICWFVAGPLAYLTLAMTPTLPVIIGVFVFVGILARPINPIFMMIFQEHTPPGLRGRAFGVLNALAMAATPLGMALGGFLVEGLGLVPTLIGMGVFYLVLTSSMFFNPALRDMDGSMKSGSRTKASDTEPPEKA
ncbi:MAG: MFS transporter [Rubrobacter sp.]|nr:MFS transporter [Rubrobacter sp.]